MFKNVTPIALSADQVVAKVASALHNGTKKGAVVTSDVEHNLFKVMGMSESEVYKVNVIDLGQWLYRWVESRLDSAFIDGGWIDCDKYPGFSSFDIRIEEGKLLFVPWDEEAGEHVMDESETLISLKGIDYQLILETK
jgi:hypothetical protein